MSRQWSFFVIDTPNGSYYSTLRCNVTEDRLRTLSLRCYEIYVHDYSGPLTRIFSDYYFSDLCRGHHLTVLPGSPHVKDHKYGSSLRGVHSLPTWITEWRLLLLYRLRYYTVKVSNLILSDRRQNVTRTNENLTNGIPFEYGTIPRWDTSPGTPLYNSERLLVYSHNLHLGGE